MYSSIPIRAAAKSKTWWGLDLVSPVRELRSSRVETVRAVSTAGRSSVMQVGELGLERVVYPWERKRMRMYQKWMDISVLAIRSHDCFTGGSVIIFSFLVVVGRYAFIQDLLEPGLMN